MGAPLLNPEPATEITNDDDEALALRAGGGCRASFATLLHRHYDGIHRLAWRWSESNAGADDIAQDVCVKLAQAIKGFRAEASFKTWLYRIVYTTALDQIRAKQRIVAVDPSQLQQLVDSSQAAIMASGSDTEAQAHEVWERVKQLPPQQRDAVLLVYGEELSHRAAGEIMGCSEKTVSWHIHEAKKALKRTFKAAD